MLRDKQDVLTGGQTGCPYWGTDKLPLLGDKQAALTRETNKLPLLGNKQTALTGETNRLPLLGDRQVALILG